MNSLKTVLKSYDIHFDRKGSCRGCAYDKGFGEECYRLLVHDLRYHAERLYKDNKKLIKDIRDIERYRM